MNLRAKECITMVDLGRRHNPLVTWEFQLLTLVIQAESRTVLQDYWPDRPQDQGPTQLGEVGATQDKLTSRRLPNKMKDINLIEVLVIKEMLILTQMDQHLCRPKSLLPLERLTYWTLVVSRGSTTSTITSTSAWTTAPMQLITQELMPRVK